MPLLFWYLPFMILSGAFDALCGHAEPPAGGGLTAAIGCRPAPSIGGAPIQ